MQAVKNDRLIRALKRQSVDKTPVWVMRQAGRYLPEYRATRKKAGDFLTLCKTPELACEVTMQPLRRFDLDAAILFSDILTIPDAMGLGLYFAEGHGPRFERPLRDKRSIDALGVVDPHDSLSYVCDAVKTIQQALDGSVPLIGFAGSPWTLATYMIEGGSSKTFSQSKKLMYTEPALLHQLLEKLSESTRLYLQAQIDAGVQVVKIFDTWGGILTPTAYQEFSLRYMQNIVNSIRAAGYEEVPIILFTKGAGAQLESIAATGCQGVGLDWTTNIGDARSRIGDKVALQGNLDPGVLYGSTDSIEAEVAKILADFGPGEGHIFNLGHGITPDVDPENMAYLIDCVHRLSEPYHR